VDNTNSEGESLCKLIFLNQQAYNMKINNTFFILYVKDQESSTKFYKNVFKKEPDLYVTGMTEFTLSDNCSLGLMPVSGIKELLGNSLPNPSNASGIPRSEIYFNLENPESYFERALQNGAILLSDFRNRDWGDKVAYCLDPDGHVIAFAENTNISC
jgi:lactoylglutathione lyase